MIFQEPATSLNPVMTVGAQIVEAIEAHSRLRGAAARAKAIEWLGRGRHPRRRAPHRRISVPPFRRAEAARHDRHDARRRARLPGRRRADDRARRDHPGADPGAAAATCSASSGMGLLLITHDLAVVSGMAHRVALMYAGQIIEVAERRRLLCARRSIRTSRLLLQRAARRGRRGGSLAAIRGSVPPLWRASTAAASSRAATACSAPCPTTRPALTRARRERQRPLPALYRAGRAGADRPAGRRRAGRRRRRPGRQRRRRRAAARAGEAAPAAAARCENLAVRFPIRRGLLQRTSGVFRAVDGVSLRRAGRDDAGAGRRVGLRQDDHRQGDRPAAARRRGHRGPRPDGRRTTCSSCEATPCARRGARSRSSSRTPSPRSTRGCGC